MRPGGGKGKGSAFERMIAKQIVYAFRKYGIHQRECWRSCLSGGHIISAGDLAMSDRLIELFPFAVECKAYGKIKWWHFLIEPNSQTQAWIEHKWMIQAAQGAAKRKGLIPLLIMKENHGPIIVGQCGQHPLTVWRFVEFKHFLRDAVDNARRKRRNDD